MSNSARIGDDTLWVEFDRQGDRFHHQIFCASSPGPCGLLVSQEGQPDNPWPQSPPLQSLHMETRHAGLQTALLVGMAGRSHWSMSVEIDRERRRLVFDVACRVYDAPHWLGSVYVAHNKDGLAGPLDCLSLIAWQGDDSNHPIAVEYDHPTGRIQISAPAAQGKHPETVRWRYAISAKTGQ